ncbi:c-type cytochrome [Flavobacterium sp. XS2P12]|jgi:cytochrome c|uniref:c-type cytochrome n=1 Tax=Flavobacterium melibiosi TaxID=3398734 RepID=UPI003A89A39F
MKKVLIIAIAFLAFSCKKQEAEPTEKKAESEATVSEGMQEEIQTPEQLGEALFKGKGTCASCHKVDTKLIGPSLQDIAKIYKEKNGNIITFLKGESEPIVDPAQYDLMKPNIVLTKTMTDEELKGLEAYLYSTLK